jgi:hypothetical protein
MKKSSKNKQQILIGAQISTNLPEKRIKVEIFRVHINLKKLLPPHLNINIKIILKEFEMEITFAGAFDERGNELLDGSK